MNNYQYMRIPLKYFTQETQDEYDIMNSIDNNYVYIEIRKGMYDIKEAGILFFNYVVENLAPHGYLWKHKTKKTTFVLCVDNFGIKYHNQDDLNQLLNALRTKYEISTDLTSSNHIGLTIKWEYEK